MEQHAFTVSEPRWVEKKWTEHYGKRRLTSSGWKELEGTYIMQHS